MNVVAKLVGFALVLLFLFAGGFALGRAVGPVSATAPTTEAPAAPDTEHSGAHS